ncbi:MAG TPA: hypothetical protein VED40_20380 [Azospirillaceae bacterium]|nr:hypothetical protein [Azospirillaceae bacterium]
MPRLPTASAAPAAAAILLAGLVLVWPAFWSGYPLVFSDSASFLGVMNPWGQHWARPIFYSLALIPFTLNWTLWPAVVLQGVVMAHLIWLTLRTLGGGVRRPVFAGVVLLVAAGSSLPWYLGQIMPDFLAPTAVLCAFLLGFGGDRISRLERWWLAALLSLSVAAHLSHLPLAAGLAVCVAALRPPLSGPGTHRAALLPMVAAIAAAMVAHLAVNTVVRGHPTLSPSGSIFMLARSVADGPAKAYLRDACPEAGYRLCPHVDQLPDDADIFLWERRSPFWTAAGLNEHPERQTADGMNYQPEAQAILDGTFERHLGWQAEAALRNTLRQLAMNDTGDGMSPIHKEMPVSKRLAEVFPDEHDEYLASRQLTGALQLDKVNALHRLAWPAAALVMLAVAVLRRSSRYRALAALVALGILGNAIIMGSISGPHHRYGGRMICLVVLGAAAALALPRRRAAETGAGSLAGSASGASAGY